jgi:hypothetical protein
MKFLALLVPALTILAAGGAFAGSPETSAAAAEAAFSEIDAKLPGLPAPSAPATVAASLPDRGAFLYSRADGKILFCAAPGCRTAAEKIVDVLPDGARGLYAFGAPGVTHCERGICSALDARLSFSEKFTRAGARLYGTSPDQGTWLCDPKGCRLLAPAFFDSRWGGAFDATGFWGSGPQGTWRCDDASCRKISDVRLDVLFSVGTPGGKGLAWGGNPAGTWRCTESDCRPQGGLSWYNTYAFDDAGNLFGSSSYPKDSTYVCSENGCRKIDGLYRYWHGPDGRGGMIASLQTGGEAQRCDAASCVETGNGAAQGPAVIGPVASSPAAVPDASVSANAPGMSSAATGTDGAVYAVRAKTGPALDRRARASAPAEFVRIEGGRERALAGDAAACWNWEYDEDSPSEWSNACSFY